MTVYALRTSDAKDRETEDFEHHVKGVWESLKGGEGRFGWSHVETANLRDLKLRIEQDGWDSLSEQEQDCYQAKFLLDLRDGDHVVYINVPEYGKCTLARVTGEYQWRWEGDDFNHRIPVDPDSVDPFDRWDNRVHPYLRARLMLQQKWWRITAEKEFDLLRESLSQGGKPTLADQETNRQHLLNAIQPHLSKITQEIHKTHPNVALEYFMAFVLERVPGVIKVTHSGGPSDHGADLLVECQPAVTIPGLEKPEMIVVQVKSYEGQQWDRGAVDDIKRAFEKYPDANKGLIVSTAVSASSDFEQALEDLQEDVGKPVSLLIGSDLAKFCLRHAADVIG